MKSDSRKQANRTVSQESYYMTFGIFIISAPVRIYLIQAIEAGLQPHDVWTSVDGTEASLFDYDMLEKMNIIYAKQT